MSCLTACLSVVGGVQWQEFCCSNRYQDVLPAELQNQCSKMEFKHKVCNNMECKHESRSRYTVSDSSFCEPPYDPYNRLKYNMANLLVFSETVSHVMFGTVVRFVRSFTQK